VGVPIHPIDDQEPPVGMLVRQTGRDKPADHRPRIGASGS
jgi:hypothetical protein